MRVLDRQGSLVFEGQSRDEGFDTNDHLGVELPFGRRFEFEAVLGDRRARRSVKVRAASDVVTLAFGRETWRSQ